MGFARDASFIVQAEAVRYPRLCGVIHAIGQTSSGAGDISISVYGSDASICTSM